MARPPVPGAVEPRRRRALLVLLAINLAVVAAMTTLALRHEGPRAASADVFVRIEPPRGPTPSDVPVRLRAPNTNALGALRAAAAHQGIAVTTHDYPGLGTMVVAVGADRNEGACGWVYEVDDASGDRAADLFPVHDGDHVRWFWSCTDG